MTLDMQQVAAQVVPLMHSEVTMMRRADGTLRFTYQFNNCTYKLLIANGLIHRITTRKIPSHTDWGFSVHTMRDPLVANPTLQDAVDACEQFFSHIAYHTFRLLSELANGTGSEWEEPDLTFHHDNTEVEVLWSEERRAGADLSMRVTLNQTCITYEEESVLVGWDSDLWGVYFDRWSDAFYAPT